jgi:hypothetical protein
MSSPLLTLIWTLRLRQQDEAIEPSTFVSVGEYRPEGSERHRAAEVPAEPRRGFGRLRLHWIAAPVVLALVVVGAVKYRRRVRLALGVLLFLRGLRAATRR